MEFSEKTVAEILLDIQKDLKTLEAKVDKIAQPANGPRYIRIEQVSEITGLSKSRIYFLIRTGGIPHVKKSRFVYFLEADLQKWLASGRQVSPVNV